MKKILYTISVLALIIAININGMEQELAESEQKDKKEIVSLKTSKGLSWEDLIFPKKIYSQKKKLSKTIHSSTLNNNPQEKTTLKIPILPSENSYKIEKLNLSLVNFTYDDGEEKCYFLLKNSQELHFIFSKTIVNPSEPIDIKKTAKSLYYQNPYFFYHPNMLDNNTICVHRDLNHIHPLSITHNKPIIAFGNIQNTVFTGSAWPSIKKTIVRTKEKDQTVYQEPFIENAFLLGCKDNGMVIAKVDAKNNSAFWFWRRFFNEKQDVHVTLYALFFDKKKIEDVTKKDIELLLEQAEKKTAAKNGNCSVRQIATNVLLTAQAQTDPAKYFPKVAIAHDTAIVIHTQLAQEKKVQTFDNSNPKVSIVYKDFINQLNENKTKKLYLSSLKTFKTNATHFNNVIKKQKQILNNYIRLPHLDEIKNIYLTTIDNQDLCMLVSQTDGKGFCADGVYFLPMQELKNQSKSENVESKELPSYQPTTKETESKITQNEEKNSSEQPQPLWHIDIEYEQKNYNKNTKRYDNEYWKAIEKVVASTFDYTNNKLFLITQEKNANTKEMKPQTKNDTTEPMPVQTLITINVQEYIQLFLDEKKEKNKDK